MRPKSLVLLLLALGCGLVASIGISEIIDSRDADSGGVETEAILVAMMDIERNTEFSAENLTLTEWPKSNVPEGAVRDLAELEGRRPTHKISTGMPILQGDLGSGESSVTGQIPQGYRVVSVRVTDESSAANMIRPGDRVDVQVYLRKSKPNGIRRTTIRTFLKDVSVFAVNAEIRSDVDSDEPIQARTISLLATPEQASKIAFANEVGKIRLVLRAAQDEVESKEKVIGMSEILGESEKSGKKASNEKAKKTMFDWLQEQTERFQKSLASHQAAQVAQAVPPPVEQPWVMLVHRGEDISVEEFQPGALTSSTIATTTGPSAADNQSSAWPDGDADATDADPKKNSNTKADADKDDKDGTTDEKKSSEKKKKKRTPASDLITEEKAKELGKKFLDSLNLND